MSDSFTCRDCGASFTLPPATLAKFPGWVPKQCLKCRGKSGGSPQKRAGRPAGAGRAGRPAGGGGSSKELLLTPEEVLARYTEGPHDGVFTDGACSGNPGPGGWGLVWVKDNQILDQRNGSAPDTTNNRMEMVALIEAYRMLPEDSTEVIWSDSQLCVNTINEWAAGWETRGWKRKGGPIKNLELVKQAYALAQAHPQVQLRWLRGHNNARWNEYADALATSFMRKS